jgi:BirA family biotin operon repressor/biotin-[acetyl-CoA-carboxylase] ligase
VVDDLQLESLHERVTGKWGSSLTVYETTTSTMNDASVAAAEGAPEGHVVLADQQTHGRGAHGRDWVSPPGTDLYFSVVTRPAVDPASTALVTLAAGLGVRDAVAASLPGRSVLVKWPNDIWIERRKCAGILVESRTVGTRLDSMVIGVGLNVNRMQWPPDLAGAVTSLRAERDGEEPFGRAETLAILLSHMERWVSLLVTGGASVVVDALRPNLALVGERVRWEDGEGVFDGIDEDGAARVRTESGVLSLHSAHIEAAER